MTTPSPNGGNYGAGGWMEAGHIPPPVPNQMIAHPPTQSYNPVPASQPTHYNLWSNTVASTTPTGSGTWNHFAGGGNRHGPIINNLASYPQQPAQTGPDMPTVLLALADTYITAAHSNGYKTALGTASDVKAYYKLLSTGLGCLEAALQYRLQTRTEAMARLRYATILYEETDNLGKAEETLRKAISLAGRNNLIDLKYSLQYLLVQILAKNNHRAALKLLSTHISDVENLDIPLWIYSFRLLRSSMLVVSSPARDEHAAMNTLRAVSAMSKERRDAQIEVLASLMEAMILLRNGADSVEAAQRVLTRVFTLQNSGIQMPPQLEVLTQLLDVCSSLMLGRTPESEPKIRKLHSMLDEKALWTVWKEDGEFELSVNSSRPGKPPEGLRLRWLSKDDVFSLGYLLSGLCKFQKNVEEKGKAEKFLTEGLKTVDRINMGNVRTSLEASICKLSWRRTLKCYMYLYYIFLLCMRTDWDSALKALKQLNEVSIPLELPIHSPLALQITYLHAIINHGTNDLNTALQFYNTIIASLPTDSELSIISKLNSVLILRLSDPPKAESLLASIERLCPQHKNELLKAAYTTVKATERGELVRTKNYLSVALRQATCTSNVQLTFIVLNFMCHRFFAGVVSEQAEKSARAALQNAKKGRDTLWALMGGQMYADCLARKGHEVEEMRQRQINEEARIRVVNNLTRHFPPQASMADNEESRDAAV